MLRAGFPGREPPPLAPAQTALFLDIDGTLLEIAATPSAVSVDRALVELIARIYESGGGALALISGRRITDIDGLFPGLSLPVAGQHGIERRDAEGRLHDHAVPRHDLELLRRDIAALAQAHRGLLFEDKGATLALHFRARPELQAELSAALEALRAPFGDDFSVQPGKMVLELKPAGKDKGTAVEEFMREAPFAGRVPAFLGDDVTDEYGFRVVNAAGGRSIKVGDGISAACWRLTGVGAVRQWLARCLASGGGITHELPGRQGR